MNNNRKLKDKKKKIGNILPLLWDSYEHMHNVRKTSIQNSINFLLIVTTFLPILSATLYTHFANEILLIPIAFQIFVLLILLKSFFIKGQSVPWLETKETLQKLEKEEFEVHLFATLKAAEEDTWIYIVELEKIIKNALNMLIFSLFSVIIAVIFIFLSVGILPYVLTIMVTFSFSLLYMLYYLKPSKFDFNTKYENHKKEIEKWLKK